MKTIRCIYCDLQKSIFALPFFACVVITFILCFTAVGYSDTSRQYSIINIITTFPREQITQGTMFSSISIFMSGGGSWLSMFIPIVAAFPFIPVFCDERSSGNMRFAVARVGRTRYNFSKFCASFVSAGLAVMLGYALFGIVISFIFPPLASYPQNQIEMFLQSFKDSQSFVFSGLYNSIGNGAIVLAQLMQMFLFGAVASLFAFALSSFVKNKYLIMCIPFALKYIYDQSLKKLWLDTLHNSTLHKAVDIFQTINLTNLFSQRDTFLWILALNAGFALVCFFFFAFFMNRRLDYGA